MKGWLIVLFAVALALWFKQKNTSTADTSFSGTPPQRGLFGTGTGLY